MSGLVGTRLAAGRNGKVLHESVGERVRLVVEEGGGDASTVNSVQIVWMASLERGCRNGQAWAGGLC